MANPFPGVIEIATLNRTHRLQYLEEARQWIERFVSWYNTEHRHSGIQFVTPDQRHRGDDKAILKIREATYLAAKKANPERWSGEIRQWKWQETVALDNQNDKKGNKAAYAI